MIVTFKNYGENLIKITAGFYDQSLLEIYTEDWSEFINDEYSSFLNSEYSKDKIKEINNKVIAIENAKEDLTEFIGTIEEQENKKY